MPRVYKLRISKDDLEDLKLNQEMVQKSKDTLHVVLPDDCYRRYIAMKSQWQETNLDFCNEELDQFSFPEK